MSPPERFPPDDPREWLNRAASSLALAGLRGPEIYLEDLCLQAQQAAEKAIKAVMIARNIEFPYVHDLAVLLTILEERGEDVPESVWRAERLTRFAVVTRYPGTEPAVTEAQLREALETAKVVVRWAEDRVHVDLKP